MDPMHVVLRKLALRLGIQQWIRFFATALLYSASLALVWVILARLFPVLGEPLQASVALLAGGVVLATMMAIVRRPTLVKAALEADRQLGLNERLTSSLELADAEGPMVEALHLDARRRITEATLQGKFRLSTTRAVRWAWAPLMAFGLAYMFLPEFDLLKHRERVAEAKAQDEETAVRVERLMAAIKPLEDKLENAEVLAEITADVESVAEDLKMGEITEKQALAKLANVAQELQKQRDGLAQGKPKPKIVGDEEQLGMAKDLAAAIQEGRMDAAMQEAKDLKKKLEEGELGEKEMSQLAKNLESLSKMMGQENSEIGQALANAMASAAEAMKSGDAEGAKEAMEALELALADMESILQQLEQMDMVMANLSEWQQDLFGPSDYCRICGAKLTQCDSEGGECEGHGPGHSCAGVCEGHGAGFGQGLGLRGPGRGQGNQVGELPDIRVGFQPTQTGGPMTQGRMLADILQKAAPREGEQSDAQFISGAFKEVHQAAERALTQEEIPPGSKEYVRQYFGSLDPEKESSGTP